jgi:predicted AlkP superfamily phosphohydrolase/phosphomutase
LQTSTYSGLTKGTLKICETQEISIVSVSPKVLLIGLDAADCDYIEANLARLPNIAGFLGGRGLHRLNLEPLSGAVWSSFNTGLKPAAHGVYHHMQWDPVTMRIRRTHPDWIGGAEPFWRDLARSGAQVAAFDVPFAFRGDTGGALEIANWGSHDLVEDFWTSDAATRRKVTAVARRHPMGFEVPVPKSVTHLNTILADILRGIDVKTEMMLGLLEQASWDMFLVVFGELHRGGHIFWPRPEGEPTSIPHGARDAIYERMDTALGRVFHAVGDTTDIVLFALHGMEVNHSQSHLSQAMLLHGLGTAPDARQRAPDREDFGLIRELRRHVPPSLQHWIADRVPQSVRDFVLARELVGGLDWTTTRAFSLQGDVSGYWRFNLSGREARGVVPGEDYDALCEALAQAAKGFVGADGAALVSDIVFPARDWAGARAQLLPDVVINWNTALSQSGVARHPDLEAVRAAPTTGRSGNHRFTGFFAHRGPRPLQGAVPSHISEIGAFAKRLLDQSGPAG